MRNAIMLNGIQLYGMETACAIIRLMKPNCME